MWRPILGVIVISSLIGLGGQMITALAAILAGTIAFWSILILSFGLMAYWLDDDEPHGVLTTLTFIATILLLGFVNKGPVHTLVHDINLSKLLVIIVLYIVLGICWSFVKWYSFLLKRRDHLIERAERSMKFSGVHGTPKTSSVPARSAVISREDIPLAKDNKSKIILWMSYWPWSALWTILNDPIKRLFSVIYRKISVLYQKISDRVFKDVSVGL